MIVTVTLNAAIDRTLTVPNFQLGQRHRASAGLTLAGGKGINVARALKHLGVPVVATGLAGGRTGTRIVEELTGEAILNDFVRIGDESRTSTAVVDPTGSTYTEINEWGPLVEADELTMLLEKLHYLSRGADFVVLSGSLPRGVDGGFYAELIRELNRRQVLTVLDSEGEPLRLGLEAEPFLVSRGGGAGRAGVLRAAGLRARPRAHRRARRPQRADLQREWLLCAAARRKEDTSLPGTCPPGRARLGRRLG
jgi:1-phosphofructokinase family hexose kinase